ncbi:AMP-binding protein [Streptomyces sp. HD]|uniref:AMP-binding protein n=1 Tax=Streptomyces sp. HD TaxID=3020892 RepID=UPI00232EAE7F|nr:AMP-binding protein [Streptomyces sp. HD]MDC0772601.1 AMP-binding protein [Streptomyces sp. HD]
MSMQTEPTAPGAGRASRAPRRGETMHELFRWCAARRPDSVAVVHGERRVTYGALDAASDDYAVDLARAGVGPGDRVPVLMARTPEFIAVLLAILKRGAAYAALDPRWPDARLTHLVGLLGAARIVTDITGRGVPGVAALAPPGLDAAAARHRRPEPVAVSASDPCAVFFTSGSTGLPKAVVSPHSGTVRLFDDCDFADFGPGAVVPQTAPMPWDGFTLDCWSVLLSGGTSLFVDDPVLLPAILGRLVRDQGVTGAFLTTVLFNTVMDEDPYAFTGMKWVLTGGERASGRHMRRFLDLHPGTELRNVYGPVESTALVSGHLVTAADCTAPEGVPLGTALNNTGLHVLDGERPCGPGEVGEICVSGQGLVDGYLGDPELTARKFPELDLDGARRRVYRTGDRGYWSPAGVLYFAGRDDRQFKVRGHRIEPGEIERCAQSSEAVTAASVVPVRDRDGRCTALDLFYVASGAAAPGEEQLRAELARHLAPYLVPSRVYRIDELPMLANAKADLRRLEELSRERRANGERGRREGAGGPDGGGGQPADHIEAEVAAAFRGVLETTAVPFDVSFFALGGSSLGVGRLCARLGRALGVVLPASAVFEHPTVRGLAAWVRTVPERAGEPEGPAGPVSLPLHHALYLWEGVSAEADTAYLCPMAWWIDGAPDTAALAEAVRDVHRRHEGLRARYAMRPGPVAEVLPPGDGPELLRLSEEPDEAAATAALRRALLRPLSLAEGRIWRCALVRSRAGGRTLFGTVVHHVAFDGGAEPVLASELSTAYAARSSGVRPDFEGAAATLADWSAFDRARLAAADRSGQLAYWEREFADLPEWPNPRRFDNGRPAGTRHAVSREATPEQLAPWDAWAARRGLPRLGFLAGVCAQAVRRVMGADATALMVPVARPVPPDAGPSVLCTVDSLCVRLRPEEAGDGADGLLEHTAAAVRRALSHQDVPFLEAAAPLFGSGRSQSVLGLPVLLVHPESRTDLELSGCATEFVRPAADTTMTELEIQTRTTADGGLTVTAAVWTDRLPKECAAEFAAEFHRILRAGPGAGTH